ncbi:MAG: hypothetical protein ACPLSY_03520 [Moorellaceae bacterium]
MEKATKRPRKARGRGVKGAPRVGSKEEVRRRVEQALASAREGDPLLPELVNLPVMEMLAGLPRTFITFGEWCSLGWFDIPLNPFSPLEWEDDFDDLNSRFTDVLFGAWLAWYYNYVGTVGAGWERGTGPSVRRLDGMPVSGLVIEERRFRWENEGYRGLYATFSVLKCPVNPDWVACVACVLHTAEGDYYAEVLAWNVMDGRATLDDALAALEGWAARSCPDLKGKLCVPEPCTMCPEPGGLSLMYRVPTAAGRDPAPEGQAVGKVIPFRPRGAPPTPGRGTAGRKDGGGET